MMFFTMFVKNETTRGRNFFRKHEGTPSNPIAFDFVFTIAMYTSCPVAVWKTNLRRLGLLFQKVDGCTMLGWVETERKGLRNRWSKLMILETLWARYIVFFKILLQGSRQTCNLANVSNFLLKLLKQVFSNPIQITFAGPTNRDLNFSKNGHFFIRVFQNC